MFIVFNILTTALYMGSVYDIVFLDPTDSNVFVFVDVEKHRYILSAVL